jgi:tetratricopeptide (TPR) repeat protein
LFRLLALHPGPDIDAYAAGALAQLPLAHTTNLLEDLCDLHLLIPHAADRYRFHDLTRGYAQTVGADEPEADRDQARHRLLDYYLCVTEAAAGLLLPHRRRLGPPLKYPPADIHSLSNAADARAWFRTEHGNLLAVARLAAELGTTEHGWQIPRNVSAYLLVHGDLAMGAAVQEITLAACRTDTDPLVRTICLYNLAILYQTIGRYPSALGCLDRSLALARESGDWAAESSCLIQMADIHNHMGEFTQAVALSSQAMQAFRADGQRMREAEALVALVEGLVRLGRSAEAVERARQAAIPMAELAMDSVSGALLSRLGIAHSRLNQHDLAIDLLVSSVEMARRDEDLAGQEAALFRLAQALHRCGRLEEALAYGQEALEIMARVTDPADLAEIHNILGTIQADLGNCAEALAHHQEALAVLADVGYRIGQAHAHQGIAVALDGLGDPATGRTHRRRASDLFAELGVLEP